MMVKFGKHKVDTNDITHVAVTRTDNPEYMIIAILKDSTQLRVRFVGEFARDKALKLLMNDEPEVFKVEVS